MNKSIFAYVYSDIIEARLAFDRRVKFYQKKNLEKIKIYRSTLKIESETTIAIHVDINHISDLRGYQLDRIIINDEITTRF